MSIRLTSLLTALCLVAPAAVISAQQESTVYLVSNAHFDSQWDWDVQESITKYVPATLYGNLTLLERYPDYVFNFEGGVKYAWMKEYYPESYAKVRQYVEQGRWHISGASWEASDGNIPSPESMTRNILYGQHFYKSEFGVLSTDIFLPDCFGFGCQIPTVARHCSLIGFSTQKLQWRNNPFYGDRKEPFAYGKWYGIDGSFLYAALRTGKYTKKFGGEDISYSKEIANACAAAPCNNTTMLYYGVGDRGGAPTLSSVRSVVAGIHGDGPVKVIAARSDDFFNYLDTCNVPLEEHHGELLMDVHGTGCYTSQAAMKLYNRRNEQLADAAEHSAVAADWLGEVDYPGEFLGTAWKRFLWHQFHDDLTGTSIPRVYEFSWNDELLSLRQFAGVLETSVGAVSRHLDTDVKGTPLVVYNPLAFERTGIVTLEGVDGRIYDSCGKAVPCQKTSDGRTIFVAKVPSLGYAVFSLRSGTAPAKGNLNISDNSIENSIYKVTLDANGDIASIVDKRYGKQLVEVGKAIRLAMFTKNESFEWPAWEVMKTTIDEDPVAVDGNVRISIAENGPVRGAIKVERTFGESSFTQYICLYNGADADRIDIVNDIDWESMGSLLKAEFPLTVSNKVNRYDIGVGSVERGVNVPTAYEVYAQQWADLTDEDGSYGVSVMNDCKYGWDKPAENMLRLTLLHTPSTQASRDYQSRQDLGHHIFTYSIVGHQGDFRNASTVRKAEALNQPLTAFTAPRHKGELGKSFSFATTSDNVELKALKGAEDTDAYIVRVYETAGLENQKAGVRFAAPIVYAEELDGNETEIGPAAANGTELTFDIAPFSIKTFLVKLDRKQGGEIKTAQLELPLKVNAASFNAFRHEGNFDGSGISYAAELFPETVIYRGISFKLGDPAAATAMQCAGQSIALPEGRWNKVYLLAASFKGDAAATFSAGDSEQKKLIPYFTSFYGQWGHTGHTEGFMKDAEPAFVGTHKHNSLKNIDVPYEFTYMFLIELDVPAGAKEIVMPEDGRVMVFAAVAADDAVNAAEPCSDLLRVNLTSPEGSQKVVHTNMLRPEHITGCSGSVRDTETPEYMLDGKVTTKWCDVNRSHTVKYVDFDLGEQKEIRGWYVFHGGLESVDFITEAFSLLGRNAPDEPWTVIDDVKGNDDIETDRALASPVSYRYLRFEVTHGEHRDSSIARIPELCVYQ